MLWTGDVCALLNPTRPCVFSYKVAPGDDVGNLVCSTGAARARLALECSPLSALRGGDLCKIQCAVPLCFAMQACVCLRFALESLLSMLWASDVCALGIPQNHVFSRTKWLPATMLGTSSVQRVRPALVWRSIVSAGRR